MPSFAYSAIDETGRTIKGTVQAETPEEAETLVSSRGLMPSDVREEGAGNTLGERISLGLTKVKTPDLILLTKQFKTMFSAGIAIGSLLEILKVQTVNKKLKATIDDIAKAVVRGSTLHEAFSKHGDVFSPLYCSMLRAGELSGTLPQVLERMIYIIEHEFKVRKQIVSAMTYPIIVVIMLVIAFFFLLTFVIPKFVAMFESAHVPLPWPTRMCITMYDGLMRYWPLMLAGVAGLLIAAGLVLRTDRGRYIKDIALLKVPLVGGVLIKGAMARFTSIFALLQSSGVSILETIRILASTIDNAAIAKSFVLLEDKIREGHGIAGPLRASPYFPPMVVNMIAIGEESGNLDEMLREVSRHYDYEVEHALGRLTELIGPILIVSLTGVVGFFALSIYLPLIELIKSMH